MNFPRSANNTFVCLSCIVTSTTAQTVAEHGDGWCSQARPDEESQNWEELRERRRRRRRRREMQEDPLTSLEVSLAETPYWFEDPLAPNSMFEDESAAADNVSDEEETVVNTEVSSSHHGHQYCLICMEAFTVGDEVAFSANDACGHAFHHNCIKHWLLRHRECPCCRQLFLAIDGCDDLQESTVQEFAIERLQRRDLTCFCVTHGVVNVNKQKATEQALQSLGRKTDGAPGAASTEQTIATLEDSTVTANSSLTPRVALCPIVSSDSES